MKYFLLELFPAGNFTSGNRVISQIEKDTKDEAILLFQKVYPELGLDKDGYAKKDELTYCLAKGIR